MNRNKLIAAWCQEGLMTICAHDGVPLWNDSVAKVDRTLLGILRDEGKESFIKACEVSGFKSNQILQKYSLLTTNDEDYGMPPKD